MAYTSLLPLLAGVAAAQVLARPGDLNFPAMKLLNPLDSAYQICTSASSFLAGCYNQFGGEAGLSTADPTAVNKCACCAGTVDVAPAFSVCSSYLSAQAPLLSTQYSAYGNIYSICASDTAICASAGAGSGSAPPAKTTPPANPFASASGSASPSQSNSQPLITSAPVVTGATPPQACTDMVDYFTSCEFNTPGFSGMPFGQQASCYCCQTSNGRVFSTNGLDQAASSCAAWAITGEPHTIYPAASTFASFCKVLGQGICQDAAPTSAPTSAPATPTQANPRGGAGQTTPAPSAPSNGDDKSSAVSSSQIGYAGCLIAVAAFAMMLS